MEMKEEWERGGAPLFPKAIKIVEIVTRRLTMLIRRVPDR